MHQPHTQISRRAALHIGSLGAIGISLGDVLRAEATQKTTRPNSLILLWMRGGPSQHETWDPKPGAPAEYRGVFGATASSVPGIQICDLLPKTARIMDHWSIVRSLHHRDAGHSSGDQLCFTGYPNSGDPNTNSHPSIGAVVAEQLGKVNRELPAYVMVPRNVPGTGSAYLGPSCQAFETIADPAREGPFSVPNVQLAKGVTIQRISGRQALLRDFDQLSRAIDHASQMNALDSFHQQACDILTSGKAQAAFNLEAEPASVRNRYGFMPAYRAPTPDRCGVPAWSQRFLLARRLVEAGVRIVTVDCRWWDTHVKGYETMRDGFLPRWDQAYSALIEDLRERGMLESTMVLAWGEFGRTPRLNKTGGRDHYPGVFSAALAGGAIQGGRVIGSSDSKGALPKDNPKRPQDILATAYQHLGINVHKDYLDNRGRPFPVLPFGDPITELM